MKHSLTFIFLLLTGCVSTHSVDSEYYYNKYKNDYTLEDWHRDKDAYEKSMKGKWHYEQPETLNVIVIDGKKQ